MEDIVNAIKRILNACLRQLCSMYNGMRLQRHFCDGKHINSFKHLFSFVMYNASSGEPLFEDILYQQ